MSNFGYYNHDYDLLETVAEVLSLPIGAPPKAGYSHTIAEEQGIRLQKDQEGNVQKVYYPYPIHNPRAFKVRDYAKLTTPSRGFGTVGDRDDSDYFGMSDLNPGQAKRLIVVEGEADRLALLELFKRCDMQPKPDVIGVAVSNATAVAGRHRETFLKYDSVFLAFDSGPAERRLKYEPNDIKRGFEGAQDFYAAYSGSNTKFLEWPIAADLDEDGKVDAKDYVTWLIKEYGSDTKQLRFEFWGLLKESPDYQSPEIYDIADMSVESLTPTQDERGVSLTFAPQISGMIGGFARSNLGIITAPVGWGKTTFLFETALDLIVHSDKKVGLIALEDDMESAPQHLIARLCGVHPGRFIANPGIVPPDQIKAAQEKIRGKLKLVTGDRNHGRMNAQGMVSLVMEMATVHECDVIIYDNLSYIAQGVKGDQRQELESSMLQLAQITKDHKTQVIVVVQLGRDLTKGAMPKPEPYLFSIRKEHLKGSGAIEGTATWVLCACPEINPDGTKSRLGWYNDKFRRIGSTGLGELLVMDPDTGAMVVDNQPYKWSWEVKEEK